MEQYIVWARAGCKQKNTPYIGKTGKKREGGRKERKKEEEEKEKKKEKKKGWEGGLGWGGGGVRRINPNLAL